MNRAVFLLAAAAFGQNDEIYKTNGLFNCRHWYETNTYTKIGYVQGFFDARPNFKSELRKFYDGNPRTTYDEIVRGIDATSLENANLDIPSALDVFITRMKGGDYESLLRVVREHANQAATSPGRGN